MEMGVFDKMRNYGVRASLILVIALGVGLMGLSGTAMAQENEGQVQFSLPIREILELTVGGFDNDPIDQIEPGETVTLASNETPISNSLSVRTNVNSWALQAAASGDVITTPGVVFSVLVSADGENWGTPIQISTSDATVFTSAQLLSDNTITSARGNHTDLADTQYTLFYPEDAAAGTFNVTLTYTLTSD